MKTNVVKWKAFGKSTINRMWKKILIALVVSVLAVVVKILDSRARVA